MPSLTGFHLHLYQPPREEPWLGLVTNEWSAWPYHDWDERIAAECYRALVAVALTHGDRGAAELVEPLAMSSTDVAPTLHEWLSRCSPDVDQALTFQAEHSTSGPASLMMASPLVHAIVPLATSVDRERLVVWGIADYERRFGVKPRGMWLPETGVDLASLDCLARHGIEYTVLMPTQALRVRENGGEWRNVDANSLDTSKAYLVRLDEDRSIKVVFGHSGLSHRVAFGDLIDDGTALADEMVKALNGGDGAVLLVADGETYGHHHHFGDLGLAWALRRLQNHYGFETALGVWLAGQEPNHEVELAQVSAWSCAHGVERWRSDCGCVTGEQPGWRQQWRTPLRESLDWLRASLGEVIDGALADYLGSGEDALLDYGTVIAGTQDRRDFVRCHSKRELSEAKLVLVLELCEAHRSLLYSFTSCAWFFADPDEIETAIVLRYAGVALDTVRRTLGVDLEPVFLEHLEHVVSNRPGVNGRLIWSKACEPYRFSDQQIAAGFACEFFALGERARVERGHWSAVVTTIDRSSHSMSVKITNHLTFREREFQVTAHRSNLIGVMISVQDRDDVSSFRLSQLGGDVIGRVVTSWLVGPGSVDYEEALNLLVSKVLSGRAGEDEVVALVALASLPRYVTPIAEASIRRMIVVLSQQVPVLDLHHLTPLVRALKMESVVAR